MKAVTIRPIVMGMTDKNTKRINQTEFPAGTLVYVSHWTKEYYKIRVVGTLHTTLVSHVAFKVVK